MGNGFFGSMFDFNNDGNLDLFESVSEFLFINDLTVNDKLGEAGLDRAELELMDDFERNTLLEEAGINPFEFEESF